MSSIYDVIVIGCGPAGIAALSQLYQSGFSVLGLEAGPRIGGRVYSTPFGNGHIDIGAEFCHGNEDNIVYTLAKDYNIISKPRVDFVMNIIDSSGNYFSQELSDLMNEIYHETMVTIKPEQETSSESLGAIWTRKYWELVNTPKYDKIDENVKKCLLELLEKFENSLEASDSWYQTSAKGLLEYYDCEGYLLNYWKENGYSTILDILLKKYPNSKDALPINMLLNKEVVNINSNGACNVIKCADGSLYSCKHAIISIPIGVLKQGHFDLFTPKLPQTKIDAIEGIAFGTVNKIFLKYNKPWWTPDAPFFGFIWSEEDKLKVPAEDKWIIDVYGFHLPESNDSVLCFWVSGPSSRFMEMLPLEKVKKCMDRLVDQFCGKKYQIPPSTEVLRSAWYTNPYSRGSYSFKSMKTEELKTGPSNLATPLCQADGKPLVCFAGEATSTHYYSTVHGAIETGFREAKRLIEYRKTNSSLSNVDIESKLSDSCRTKNEYDVIIIGAGLAGLAAALTLLENDETKFIILEAQDYAGGRVKSEEYDKSFIEYGAQWIHGSTNRLKQLAEQFSLTSDILSTEGEGRFLRNDGFEYPPNLVDGVGKVVNDILKKCEEFATDNVSHNFSVGEFLQVEFDEHVERYVKNDEKHLWYEIYEWHLRFHEIDNSCVSLNHLSADAWGLYDFNGGDEQNHINLINGYSSIIDVILKKLPSDKLHKNKPVEEIIWDIGRTDGFKPIVVCSDGDIFSGKHIICTISLGCLKAQINKMFKPSLPQEISDSINHMGFASMGKLFIQFEENWWGDTKGFQLTWSKHSFDNGKTTFAGQDQWLRYVSGFDLLTVGPPNTFLAWVNDSGIKIMENLTTETIESDCLHIFKMITKRQSLPKVKMIKSSSWNSNQFVKGCYSHTTLACNLHKVGPDTLSKPIRNSSGLPVLFFSGEACHTSFFSTTHGAYDSGYHQALEVLKSLKH